MYSYSMTQWLFFFYFYCFVGWCIESAYVSIKSKKLTNRGFMRGPFLPLYGSGAIMMLVVSMPFQGHLVLTYVAGCIGATILEYVTGVAMEALFKVRYWDYSDDPLNFQGHICLGSSLAWGLLTILMTEVVHVPVESFVLSIPGKVLAVLTYVLTIGITSDFALSFKAAIDIRNVLVRMDQVKQEMLHIQKRLDVIIALTGQEVTNYKAALAESVSSVKEGLTEGMATRIEDVKSGIEGKLETAREIVLSKPAEYFEGIREELLELKTRYAVNVADRNRLGKVKDFFQRDMIRSNPYMTSKKYREAFEELREGMSRKKEKNPQEGLSGKKEEKNPQEGLSKKKEEKNPQEGLSGKKEEKNPQERLSGKKEEKNPQEGLSGKKEEKNPQERFPEKEEERKS